jgi:RNA polymerase sigma-70 factor (ECF subfamily)
LEYKEPNQTSEVPDPSRLYRWIEEAKRGDIGSYQEIYELFCPRILNFVYRMVASSEEAEDITQETFVAVYQKLGSLKDNSKFEPWLFRIARNFVYQRYRSRSPATVSIDLLDDEGQPITQIADGRKDPDQSLQAAELEEVVEEVIRSLPEKYREIFILAAVRRLSYQNIAEIVGRSLASVKTDIHRARLEVRKQVKDYLKV